MVIIACNYHIYNFFKVYKLIMHFSGNLNKLFASFIYNTQKQLESKHDRKNSRVTDCWFYSGTHGVAGTTCIKQLQITIKEV